MFHTHTLRTNCYEPVAGLRWRSVKCPSRFCRRISSLWGADVEASSISLIVCEITYFVPPGSTLIHAGLSNPNVHCKTENTSIYSRCVWCAVEKGRKLRTTDLNADSLEGFREMCVCVIVCATDNRHQNRSTSATSVFHYPLRFFFLCFSCLLFCHVCSIFFALFISLLWILLFYWANKEPQKVKKYNTVFSPVKCCLFPYQKIGWKKCCIWGFVFC